MKLELLTSTQSYNELIVFIKKNVLLLSGYSAFCTVASSYTLIREVNSQPDSRTFLYIYFINPVIPIFLVHFCWCLLWLSTLMFVLTPNLCYEEKLLTKMSSERISFSRNSLHLWTYRCRFLHHHHYHHYHHRHQYLCMYNLSF